MSHNFQSETHTIDVISDAERHGRPRDLFTLWFGNNLSVLALAVGAVAVQVGLSFAWACVAILAGNLLGSIFVAFHAAQGPHLGVPQMIQSRAQFGYYGAAFLLVVVFFLSFGYFASTQALSGLTLHQFRPGIHPVAAILVVTAPVVVLAFLGYRWIHRWQKAASIVFGISAVVITLQALGNAPWKAITFGGPAPSPALFLAVVAIFAVYQLTWAPYVADYSRYLPRETGSRRTFTATLGGLVLGAMWMQVLAAYVIATHPTSSSPLDSLAQMCGAWVLLVMAVSLIGSASTTLYSGMLALVTLVETITPESRAGAPAWLRSAGIVATGAVGLPFALAGYDSFVSSFTDFLQLCLFVLIPWSAVNLADYYLVRRGSYDVRALFDRRGSYGTWRWDGLIAYAVGLVVEVPFINQPSFIGPAAKAMGGADISWIVGLLVPAALYIVLARRAEPALIPHLTHEPNASITQKETN